MNPAVLNYLQAQQNQEVDQTQAPFNPFDSGIRNAIESARVSLDMTEKQQDKALRRSMLTFANNYGAEPKKKGFMANFGSAARAMAPAIMAHDDSEDMAFKENNALANQILAYQGADQDRASREEEKHFRRNQAQEQLAEQRRYHNMMADYQNKKLNMQNQKDEGVGPLDINGIEVFPIQNKNEYTAYTKDKKALGSILNEVNDLEKDYKKFRKETSENFFDPMAPGAGAINPAKNYLGRFFNNKELREETANRETLSSKLNKFVISSERALKGGGVMGPRLIELFKEQKIYPSLDEDTPEIFESKLKMLKEEIENSYKAANMSLSYKVHIDPSQIADIEKALSNENEAPENTNSPQMESIEGTNPNQMVTMHDEKGNVFQIPITEVQEAINDGLMPAQE